MSSPVLTIIAGPNGAGKSTLSNMMVEPGTFVFDGDKELAILKKRFSDTDSSILFESVNGQLFEAKKLEAIVNRQDFALETNFSSDQLMQTIEQFKRAGYEISLVYIGLPSIIDAVKRVNLRVRKGGHKVSIEDIKTNYREGLSNLKKFYKEFDRTTLIHNGIVADKPIDLMIVATIRKGKVVSMMDAPPQWARELLLPLNQKESLLVKNRMKRSKGLGL